MFFNSYAAETGIFYYHSFICTMRRSTFCKGPAKFTYLRSYNNYNKKQFENILKYRLVTSSNFEEFFDTFLATLNEHAPLKKKKIDKIFKSLWVIRFVKLSWNNLSHEIYSTRRELLMTTVKIKSDNVLSVRIYWSQLKILFLKI